MQSLETFKHAKEILGNDVGYQPVGYMFGVTEEYIKTLKKNVENAVKQRGKYENCLKRRSKGRNLDTARYRSVWSFRL
ncbi:hypothetical protein LRS37_07665 [Neobacillus sedimentimangrovi]|uniref:Uncharacterized protein n=1 Tax=Neobacillus sedimentimangrovi TaxID=2699460 RepID=A0ABS8QHN6_9BACI|nr:hypothetical protein [Neobacillus sedimentimangrovi]MCD4838753.1 hypothetical protein [Neobacillus sedimentimangrovi]